MIFGNRLLLRGLRPYIRDGSTVLAISPGVSDALGTHRRTTAVLTDDSLLLASSVRARTVLTVIPRSDMRTVDQTEPGVVRIAFDDYVRAIRRVVVLDLSQRGDKQRLIPQLLDGAVGV
jgi:hypothetical protein